MVGFKQEHGAKNLFLALPDPVLLELNRLQTQLKEKANELQDAFTEVKVLKASEVAKDRAIEELRNEVHKLDEKLVFSESIAEQKTLEAKKLTSEKKEALVAQFSAEASLRRLYENQKDDDAVPILSIIAPLEADIKMHKGEVWRELQKIAALLEDKKALERLTKSKEAALVEAERILKSALERALVVEEVQNQNSELKRQIEIYQEENKILDKTNRQKVLEVRRLTQTIGELEEAVLAGGAAANAIRDCQRQISELHEEKKTLERELARAKVSANRVATVVANKWKDENEKVMPVKQCLEERRLLQAELQRLRDKLAVSERTAKVEAQLKDKLKLRLQALEEGLRRVSSISVDPSASSSGSKRVENVNRILSFLQSSGGLKKRSTSQPRASTINRISTPLQHHNRERGTASEVGESKHADVLKHVSGEYMQGKYAAVSNGKENTGMMKTNRVENIDIADPVDVNKAKGGGGSDGSANSDSEDAVSGFLYDRLQREVINLRKLCEVQGNNLNAKDEEIKTLMKKMDALTKLIQVESKKMRRQAAARGKEEVSASAKADDESKRTRNKSNASKIWLQISGAWWLCGLSALIKLKRG